MPRMTKAEQIKIIKGEVKFMRYNPKDIDFKSLVNGNKELSENWKVVLKDLPNHSRKKALK